MCRSVRQHVHNARHSPIDFDPVIDFRARQSGRVGNRRNVQEQIGRSAHCGMHGHGISNTGRDENIFHFHSLPRQFHQCSGRPHCHVAPDRLPGRRQRRMWQRDSQRFTNRLGGGGCAEELASAARRSTSPAAEIGGFFKRNQSVGKPRANRLDCSCIRQSHATRNKNPRKIVHPSQRHHHCREPLVARCDSQHPGAAR